MAFLNWLRRSYSFLTALLPFCDQATLAFNLERDSVGPISWLSPWAVANQTFAHLHQRFSEQVGTEVRVDWLERGVVGQTRFAGSPVLGHLEAGWSHPEPYGPKAGLRDSIRIVVCPDPEAEATLAAREIVRFVRAGGEYRDVAVIVRNLESYYDPVRRAFSAFEIPFFLDRREPVGHHPLLELTRSALRTVAFGWEEDWFGALKTGLLPFRDADIDRLENEALARGWKGKTWLEPLKIPDHPEAEAWLEELRQKLVAPFQQLAADLGSRPSGSVLAQGLAAFWERLGIAATLQTWSVEATARGRADVDGLVHATIWPQMVEWLENLALAFAQETLGRGSGCPSSKRVWRARRWGSFPQPWIKCWSGRLIVPATQICGSR